MYLGVVAVGDAGGAAKMHFAKSGFSRSSHHTLVVSVSTENLPSVEMLTSTNQVEAAKLLRTVWDVDT